MTEELREFVCKHCGHKVVVNPDLPADCTPNVCTPCWETFEKPKQDKAFAEAMLAANVFMPIVGAKEVLQPLQRLLLEAALGKTQEQVVERIVKDHAKDTP